MNEYEKAAVEAWAKITCGSAKLRGTIVDATMIDVVTDPAAARKFLYRLRDVLKLIDRGVLDWGYVLEKTNWTDMFSEENDGDD